MDEVAQGLYVGTAADASDASTLREHDIAVVVSLTHNESAGDVPADVTDRSGNGSSAPFSAFATNVGWMVVASTEALVATVVLAGVTLSFPCFLYGAYIVIDNDPVTWDVLTRHLKFILAGLTLTTVPMLVWMIPRLADQFSGAALVHAFLGLQAYAMLVFAGTGIVRIFKAKREHDLYHDYDEAVLLSEIGSEDFQHWRRRLRIGVFGYVFFWLLAYVVGVLRYLTRYVLA